MHQQQRNHQIAKRHLQVKRKITFMPIGNSMLISDVQNDYNITRLCIANE